MVLNPIPLEDIGVVEIFSVTLPILDIDCDLANRGGAFMEGGLAPLAYKENAKDTAWGSHTGVLVLELLYL